MHIAYAPDEYYRPVMSGRVRITPNYVVEIMVCEVNGYHTVVCRWYPELPPWWQIDELWQEILEAKAPYLRKAAELGCLRVVGAA